MLSATIMMLVVTSSCSNLRDARVPFTPSSRRHSGVYSLCLVVQRRVYPDRIHDRIPVVRHGSRKELPSHALINLKPQGAFPRSMDSGSESGRPVPGSSHLLTFPPQFFRSRLTHPMGRLVCLAPSTCVSSPQRWRLQTPERRWILSSNGVG